MGVRPDHRRLDSAAGPGAQGAAAAPQTAILIYHHDPAHNTAWFYAMPVQRLIPFTQVRLNVVFGLAECIGSTR